MASQVDKIREFLIERLEEYDPTLDLADGSALRSEVVEPLVARLGVDFFSVDTRAFLLARLQQEFPELNVTEADALCDMLVTPLEVLLAPLKTETEIIRRGSSLRDPATMRLEDAKDLAANFFVTHNSGSRAATTARVFFSAPTFLNILPTTEFVTKSGLVFLPVRPEIIQPETMLSQTEGSEFYVDVALLAAEEGAEFSVEQDAFTTINGVFGFTRITNLAVTVAGRNPETTAELVSRTRESLVERTLTVKRGIAARLREEFPSIVDVEVVGYGDPEMQRDLLTGRGSGEVRSSGICIILGKFCLFFSTFENRSLGEIASGDSLEFNFWKFLYQDASKQNQHFEVARVLFDSTDSLLNLPAVYLLELNSAIDVAPPVSGLAGVLPGVFGVLKKNTKLTISGIPGGILFPETDEGTVELDSDGVHIGGHVDVWLRGSSLVRSTATIQEIRTKTPGAQFSDLVVSGGSRFFRHMVHREIAIVCSVSSGIFGIGEEVRGITTGAVATISDIKPTSGSDKIFLLHESNGILFSLENIVGSSGATTATITEVRSNHWPAGQCLNIIQGASAGSYRILRSYGPFAFLDTEFVTSDSGIFAEVLGEVEVDLFAPAAKLFPFGDMPPATLSTTIGSTLLKIGSDVRALGVRAGDTVTIRSGTSAGSYLITAFDPTLGGKGLIVDRVMPASESLLPFEVVRTQEPVQRPLHRIMPGGVFLVSASGEDSGSRVPYSLPVAAYPAGSFSGSTTTGKRGLMGMVLPDPGLTWAPTADYLVDIASFGWVASSGKTFQVFYSEDRFSRCYTDGCSPCSGFKVVLSVYASGLVFLDSHLPAEVLNFVANMHSWLVTTATNLKLGADVLASIEAFELFRFGPATGAIGSLLKKVEICLPSEIFDGCNNVFLAFSEISLDSEFELATIEDAVNSFKSADLLWEDPALDEARPGNILTIEEGANRGSYVIEKVFSYPVFVPGSVVADEVLPAKTYRLSIVTIKGEFPSSFAPGLASFFDDSGVSWSVPSAPDLPFIVQNLDTSPASGWDWLQGLTNWFMKWMDSLGFDLPSEAEFHPESFLRTLWSTLFTSYSVGASTCEQNLRVYFAEPAAARMWAPISCQRYQWAAPIKSVGSTISERLTLPLPDLTGLELEVEDGLFGVFEELTATLSAASGSAATISALAASLQDSLDPEKKNIVFSGPASASGLLTITQVAGGVDNYTTLPIPSGWFSHFGFFSTLGGKWAEVGRTLAPSFPVERITTDISHAIGFSLAFTISDLVLLEVNATVAEPFVIGEAITGLTSAAAGEVYAVAHSPAGVAPTYVWVTDVTGTFTVGETVEGGTSTHTRTVAVVDVAPSLAWNSATDGDYSITDTFDDLAARLEGILSSAIDYIFRQGAGSATYSNQRRSATLAASGSWDQVSGAEGRFTLSITDSAKPFALEQWELDNAVGADYDSPHFVATYMATTSPRPMVSAAGIIVGDGYSPAVTSAVLQLYVGATLVDSVDFSLDYWSALSFISDVWAPLDGGLYEQAAQALNADARYYEGSSGSRAILWFYDGTTLVARAAVAGPSGTLVTTDCGALGIVNGTVAGSSTTGNNTLVGTSSPGVASVNISHAKKFTRFLANVDGYELTFGVSPLIPSSALYPESSDPAEYPRDIRVGKAYAGQGSVEFRLTDNALPSALSLSLESGSDFIELHEQRVLLGLTLSEDPNRAADRIVLATTRFGSPDINLVPQSTTLFDFLDADTSADRVREGDLVFIEEGDASGMYRVVSVSRTKITLDRPVFSSTEPVLKSGNDGEIVPDTSDCLFSSASAPFTFGDVGRTLTIYASNLNEVVGSYVILSVSGGGTSLTLDSDPWPFSETSLHWAVVAADSSASASSEVGGRTATRGGVPVRIYSGKPSEWRIAEISNDFSRDKSRLFASLENADPPRVGAKQPHRLVRKGEISITSEDMSGNSDNGLFYVDVPAISLGSGATFNIGPEVRLEPVFGSYSSEGYYLRTEDTNLTYSVEESTVMVISPFIVFSSDRVAAIQGNSLVVDYHASTAVAEIQRLLSSDRDRQVCSSPLARHFLPSFVYLDFEYSGGASTQQLATSLSVQVDGLLANDTLDLSVLEKTLHNQGAQRYRHPSVMWALTHDLDRRIVGSRTTDTLTPETIPFNGSVRTTYFVAGPLVDPSVGEETTVLGERIRLRRINRL